MDIKNIMNSIPIPHNTNITLHYEQIYKYLTERFTMVNKLEQVMLVFNNQNWSNATGNNLNDASLKTLEAINHSKHKTQTLLDTLTQWKDIQ